MLTDLEAVKLLLVVSWTAFCFYNIAEGLGSVGWKAIRGWRLVQLIGGIGGLAVAFTWA
jgi:hypothetical protein